jgi:hypothetical protein
MNFNNNITINERQMKYFLVWGLRYALNRDNGLASYEYINQIKEVLPLMPESALKSNLIDILISDINFDLSFYQRNDAPEWIKLVDFLKRSR